MNASFAKWLFAVTLAPIILPSLTGATPSRGEIHFVSPDQTSRFQFEWKQGMIFVPVRVNGSRPLSFVLDSGSARMLIDRTLARSLGLSPQGSGTLQGAGSGRVPIQFLYNVRIDLPGAYSTDHEFSTADLKPLESSLGTPVDGIIGYEFFSRFVVVVDYPGKTLTLAAPAVFRASASAEKLALEVRNKWAFVKGELTVGGPVSVQDSFMIDTGSSDAVDHPIVKTMQTKVASISGVGIGSAVEGGTARALSFRLGSYTIPSPTISCCGGTDETSKLIGSDILKTFIVTFDYPSSRLFLQRP